MTNDERPMSDAEWHEVEANIARMARHARWLRRCWWALVAVGALYLLVRLALA